MNILKKLIQTTHKKSKKALIQENNQLKMKLRKFNIISDNFNTKNNHPIKKYTKAATTISKKEVKNLTRSHISDRDHHNDKEYIIRSELHNTSKNGQLRLHYQPMVDIKTSEIIAAEVLVRWEHPVLGLIPPMEFIPVAEETGFIIAMGDWILEEVCRTYEHWLANGLPAIKVSINFSGLQFFEENFVEKIINTIQRYKLNPHFLIIEITESILMDNMDKAIEDMKELQSFGIQIALDDFGTGYSSLAYIQSFNMDILKIDRIFVRNIISDRSSKAIIKAIIDMTRDLKIKLVAEGIEELEQLTLLRNLNCHTGQGYIYSRPLPLEEFEKLLARNYCRPEMDNDSATKVNVEQSETTALVEEIKNKNKLQLVLDSVAEGIFGVNKNGICTFCNKSSLKLLGYKHPEELIGKNLHFIIHHSRKDGTPITLEDCQILSTFVKGEGVHVDDEVFWRADGTYFEVEYFSYPEFSSRGELTDLVVTFLDITRRKEEERNILYYSYHDVLTGLYNRRFLEEELDKIDIETNLPISVIVGDVNGLKQTNDIFGHAAGDMLIQQAAGVIQDTCPSDAVCIRSGGDEFLILLPKVTKQEADNLSDHIKLAFSQIQIKSFKGSISLGVSAKTSSQEDLLLTIDKADEMMYQQKTLDHKSFHSNAITSIMQSLKEFSPRVEEHCTRVSMLCQEIGMAMQLSESELRRLTAAGYYHDIGKIVLSSEVINKEDMLSNQEMHLIHRHPVVGYRILNLSDSTLDIAKYVLSHHERWDGTGYPNQLKGEAIPKLSRILAIINSYDVMIYGTYNKKPMSKEEVIQEICNNAGTKFDPELVEIFVEFMNY